MDEPTIGVTRERQVRRMHLALIRSTGSAADEALPDDAVLAMYPRGRPLAEAIVDTIREEAATRD